MTQSVWFFWFAYALLSSSSAYFEVRDQDNSAEKDAKSLIPYFWRPKILLKGPFILLRGRKLTELSPEHVAKALAGRAKFIMLSG